MAANPSTIDNGNGDAITNAESTFPITTTASQDTIGATDAQRETPSTAIASIAKSPKAKATIIRDPIHGFIDLSYYDFIPKIIQTAPFQRLRRLSQLGVSVFVYPSATHNRFNHSLGAMQLFVRVFDHLYKDEKHDNDYEKLRMTGIASVLLHDIGHGPFSHAVL